jgi:PAS domain S-box-containing protein
MSIAPTADDSNEHRSERRLAAVVDTTSDAIVILDHAQRITLVNRAAETMFGHSRAAMLGQPIDMLIPRRYHAAHHGHVDRFGTTGSSVRRMGGDANVVGLRAGGEEFPIDASISHIVEDGKPLYTVILRDITQRKQTLAELESSRQLLRELYDGLQTIREEERKRIARELHDELGQTLAALRIDLTLLRQELPIESVPLAQRAAVIDDMILNTINAVRRISSDLRPRPLDDLGLLAAIQMLAEETGRRHAINIVVHAPAGELTLPDAVSSPLFRMVQESLTNIVKHAQASCVDIRFAREGRTLTLTVQDDGKGMDIALTPKSGSFGLIGMRERATAMGGSVEVVSEAGAGTSIRITVPLPDTNHPG